MNRYLIIGLCLALSGCATPRQIHKAVATAIPPIEERVSSVALRLADLATSDPAVAAGTAASGGALSAGTLAAIAFYKAWRKKQKTAGNEGTV